MEEAPTMRVVLRLWRAPIRASIAAALLVSWTPAHAVPVDLAAARVGASGLGSILVFGDSYSARYWQQVPSWVEQLRAAGTVSVATNHAVAGATASGSGDARTFAGQVDRWARGGGKVADTTIVYFGHNDIHRNLDLNGAKAAYARGIDRLVAAGVTSGQRRLLLTLIHDWSRNPGSSGNERGRVQRWNQLVQAVGGTRPNVQIVDLFSLFERVFANPGKHGLKNVSTPSTAASRSTHLFDDSLHFGARGQAIIARAMKTALERAAAGRATRLAELGPERPVPTLAALEPPSASPAAWPCFAHPIGATPP
jgi:lysophospholipase L1-like esterase